MLRFTANHFLTRVFICVRKAERVSTRRRMARGHTFRFSRTNENSRCGLVGKIAIVRFDGFRQIWAVCSCNEPRGATEKFLEHMYKTENKCLQPTNQPLTHTNPYRTPTARGHFLYTNFRTHTTTTHKKLASGGSFSSLNLRFLLIRVHSTPGAADGDAGNWIETWSRGRMRDVGAPLFVLIPRNESTTTAFFFWILHLNHLTVSGLYSRSRGKCQVLPTHPHSSIHQLVLYGEFIWWTFSKSCISNNQPT